MQLLFHGAARPATVEGQPATPFYANRVTANCAWEQGERVVNLHGPKTIFCGNTVIPDTLGVRAPALRAEFAEKLRYCQRSA